MDVAMMSGPMGNGRKRSLATPRFMSDLRERFFNELAGTIEHAIRR